MCTRQPRKVIWDMNSTLFLTLQLSNLLLLLFFSTRKHASMTSRTSLSSFFQEQWTQNRPQHLSGLSRALSPTTFLEIAVYRAKNVPFSSSESDESDAIPREDGRSSSSSDEDSG